MKHLNQKIRYLFFSTISVLSLLCVSFPVMADQLSLEKKDEKVSLLKMNDRKKWNEYWVWSETTGPFKTSTIDTVTISEIRRSPRLPEKAEIIIIDILTQKTIFKASMQGSFTVADLKDSLKNNISFPIKLPTNTNYFIKHGDDEWEMNFIDLNLISQKQKKIPEIVDKPTSDATTTPPPPDQIWWIVGTLILIAIIIATVLWFKRKKRVHGKTIQEEPKSSDDKGPNNISEPIAEGPSTEDIPIVQNEIYSLKKENQTQKEEIERLRRNQKELVKLLGMDDSVVNPDKTEIIHSIIRNNIEQLIRISNGSSSEKYDAKTKIENFAENIIRRIKGKDKKELKLLLKDAEEDTRGQSYEATLNKFIDYLGAFTFSESKKDVISDDSKKINSIDQLSLPINRTVVRDWLLKRLKDYGIFEDVSQSADMNIIFGRIVDNWKKSSSISVYTDEEIVSNAVKKGKLSEEDKKLLTSRLIDRLNNSLSDTEKFDKTLSYEDFLTEIANIVRDNNNRPEFPTDIAEAREQGRKEVLTIFKEAIPDMKWDLITVDKKTLRQAFERVMLSRLNDKLRLDASSLGEAYDMLRHRCENDEIFTAMLVEYGAKDKKDLVKLIGEKKLEDIRKTLAGRVANIVSEENTHSLNKLFTALINLIKNLKDTNTLVINELSDNISKLDPDFTLTTDDTGKLTDIYSQLVDKKLKEAENNISALNDKVENLRQDLSYADEKISQLKTKVNTLESDKKELMSESSDLLNSLHEGARKIATSWSPVLMATSLDYDTDCEEINEKLEGTLREVCERIATFTVPLETTIPIETRKRIQQLLCDELAKPESVLNTLCCYYAYSRLPFMTDTSLPDGIIFSRKAISTLFDRVDELYAQFGIRLDIPLLFVVSIAEGDFENVTGRAYGDLDNLHPNSRNHKDNIDSHSKPANLVVDVVEVGYTVDGIEKRKSKVITY